MTEYSCKIEVSVAFEANGMSVLEVENLLMVSMSLNVQYIYFDKTSLGTRVKSLTARLTWRQAGAIFRLFCCHWTRIK